MVETLDLRAVILSPFLVLSNLHSFLSLDGNINITEFVDPGLFSDQRWNELTLNWHDNNSERDLFFET